MKQKRDGALTALCTYGKCEKCFALDCPCDCHQTFEERLIKRLDSLADRTSALTQDIAVLVSDCKTIEKDEVPESVMLRIYAEYAREQGLSLRQLLSNCVDCVERIK